MPESMKNVLPEPWAVYSTPLGEIDGVPAKYWVGAKRAVGGGFNPEYKRLRFGYQGKYFDTWILDREIRAETAEGAVKAFLKAYGMVRDTPAIEEAAVKAQRTIRDPYTRTYTGVSDWEGALGQFKRDREANMVYVKPAAKKSTRSNAGRVRETDPDYDQMVRAIKRVAGEGFRDIPLDEIDAAIYWFASDYHTGQRSNLYSALSARVEYRPGRSVRSVKGEGYMAQRLYSILKSEFVPTAGGAFRGPRVRVNSVRVPLKNPSEGWTLAYQKGYEHGLRGGRPDVSRFTKSEKADFLRGLKRAYREKEESREVKARSLMFRVPLKNPSKWADGPYTVWVRLKGKAPRLVAEYKTVIGAKRRYNAEARKLTGNGDQVHLCSKGERP